ncbi:dicarboxylate/amino acid:cation symporter [Pseudochryseolinea flava]|uniref:Dicarboxylate/amino acid:cation symporter n=1 Tax=Pseudochryseolinea flava TaxID=2059302 RepID=A0A364Y912_9BACT|nr:cation:dicarboxylase symporter family transporter [Pseudochryseolinea flava]RAW02732.1 dicarboxylate/amino acid:cation symporter [Pseudochryseolinea flava]
MKQKHIVFSAAILFTIATALHLAQYYFNLGVADQILTGARWITWLSFIAFAVQKRSLTTWIVVSMFLGCELGYSFPEISLKLNVLSGIFLRLIKTIIAPLIFATLVVGIAAHSNLKQVGRMGLKAILYFEIVTTIALVVGLVAINLTRAGEGAEMKVEQAQVEKAESLKKGKESHDFILEIFPENLAKAIGENRVLQVVVFSVLFGVALAKLTEEKKKPVLHFTESLAEVMFKFTDLVMYVAPFAVGGALAYAVASMGFGVLKNLFMLVGTLYMALIAFILLVLVPVGFIIRLPFKRFIAAISEPVSIAFATSTSEAALPKAMENLEKFGIPRKIVAFVLPTGYSFNLDGSTLYLSLASVFIAQASGVELTIGQQIQMVLILMLTSKGVAGVRGASFLILISTVEQLGLDPFKAFAILAVDAIMDMGRTSVNVIGNCLATAVVARWEGEFPDSAE